MPTAHIRLIGTLIALVLHTAIVQWLNPSIDSGWVLHNPGWLAWLFLAPMALVGGLSAHQRWPFMAGVLYATVNLALDLATLIFDLTHGAPLLPLGLSTGPSAFLSFLAMLVAGQGTFAALTNARLPATRLPSPPSQLSP